MTEMYTTLFEKPASEHDKPYWRWALALLLVCSLQSSPLVQADEELNSLQTAREHLQRGRIDEALELLSKLSQEDDSAPIVAIYKSRCFEFRGDWKKATQILEEGAAKASDHALLAARLAEIYLAQGRFEEAEKELNRALKIDESLPDAKMVAADLLAVKGELKPADEAYHWFIKFYNQHQPEDPETLLLVARGSSQYARWHSVPQIFDFAVNTLCNDALAKDKSFWQSYALSGRLLLEKYNRAQAIPELKKGLAINPNAAEIHASLAVAALQDRSLSEAAHHIQRALETNPHSPYALCIHADVLLEEGNLAEAVAELEKALGVNPRNEEALGRLAACRVFEDGLPPAAEIDDLFSFLEVIDESTTKNRSRFGDLVVQVARWNPHPGLFLFAAGVQLEARNKFDLAERCYRQATKSMPQLPGPKTTLGMFYARTGKTDVARKLLDQAYEADPYHIRVSNMRKVLKVLEGYQTIETEHFVIRIDSQTDLVLGNAMAEFLEEEYPTLVKQFGYEPKERTQFEIYNKAKGLSAHQWFSARIAGLPWVQTIGASTGMIVAMASPNGTERPYNWARVARHEFVHILTLQETDYNIPHWFTEALAVVSEQSPRPELWDQLLLERVPKGDLMNLDTVNHGFTRAKAQDDWNMAYCQSRLYAEFMAEKFAPSKPLELLAAYREHLSTDQAIPRVFGITKGAFEQGYRSYVEEITAALQARPPEIKLTPAAAEKEYKSHPDDSAAAARYSAELLRVGKRKEARKIAQEALALNSQEPLALVVMANLALRAEDVGAATELFQKALDPQNPNPVVIDQLGDVQFKQKEFEAAAATFELGLKKFPNHVPWLRGLAASRSKLQQFDELKPILEKLIVLDGDNAIARKSRARLAFEDEQYADAIRFGRLALQIDVQDVETHVLLAKSYAELKQFEKSAAAWRTAWILKPREMEYALTAVQAEISAGRKEKAQELLREILARDPQNAEAQAVLDELK